MVLPVHQMWPLKLCGITMTVLKLEAMANNYIRKWPGLPRCLSNAVLFGSNMLQLPLQSISLGYKKEKVRLLFELRDSPDPTIRDVNIQVQTE